MPVATFSGRFAQVYVQDTVVPATRWSLRVSTDEQDVTVADSNADGVGAFADFVRGVIRAELSVDCVWDIGQNPHNNPPNLRAGVIVRVRCFPADYGNGLGVAAYDFPFLLVREVSVSADVRDALRYSFSGVAKGAFRYSDTNSVSELALGVSPP